MRTIPAAVLRTGFALGVLLGLCLAPASLRAAGPEAWVPARWDGGPLEAARRARDKTPPGPEVRDAVAKWYDPATLGLLDGTPVNCLLLTLSGGAAPEIERQQRPLVSQYARKARGRGLAVLGLVYPGADPSTVAEAAAQAQLDGVVLEGEFPSGSGFVDKLRKALRARGSNALVIPVASSAGPLRKAAWPVLAVEGVVPGVGKLEEGATASATAGLWIDSNMWLVRSFRLDRSPRPVWLGHRTGAGSPDLYLRSIADAAAAGGRWILSIDDSLRPTLLRREAKALALWRNIGAFLAFFEKHAEWRNLAPFGAVAIILDTAGPRLDNTEEFLNLVARRQIPYRVIDRSRLSAPALEGLRAVLAFDLAPPTEAERKVLRDFASQGGLVLGGPAWGSPPKDQSYTVASVDQGEVAVYKDEAPDPQSVARDLNDLLTTPDFGVSVFDAPSVLSYVSTNDAGSRMLIQMVNYADTPADALTIWVTRKFQAARLHTPESGPVELPVKRSGGRTQIVIPGLTVYGALELE
jgi:hypothetical protein